MKFTNRLFCLLLVLLAGLLQSVFAIEPVYSDIFDKAIKGYDPVAYFTQRKAVKGKAEYSYTWNGANWQFSYKQNLEAFIEDPEKYAPQYGGCCAWAVSNVYTAKIDPKAWSIHKDQLYLNYSKSVQRKWQKDIPGNIDKANKNWPVLLSR